MVTNRIHESLKNLFESKEQNTTPRLLRQKTHRQGVSSSFQRLLRMSAASFSHCLIIACAMCATHSATALAQTKQSAEEEARMHRFVRNLMKKMTLQEKLGQLNLGAGGDPMVISNSMGMEESVAAGYVSAVGGADINLQRIAVEKSRLGIPLLFGLDVIHGMVTTFPIPLAQACSWDMTLIERCAQIAAKEATASGICWTWSPMVDISRDPRWGRVAEGAGEDPYLGSRIARAMVRGYQGSSLQNDSTLLACFKHLALYGAAEGGRDYNTVDMSRWYMYNFYLPPYKAAVEEGCATGMSSFNVIDGVPATGNRFLLTDVLRDQWGFKGFVVSDANSVAEMEFHRMGDAAEVTRMALEAGLDMDMGSRHILQQTVGLLKSGRLKMKQIDEAVRRILEAKYKLGLFDDPYRYLKQLQDTARQTCILSEAHRAAARRMAGESIVLLKNDGNLLPLSDDIGSVAVVGPIGDDPAELYGTWSTRPDGRYSHTVTQALQQALGEKCTILSAPGCEPTEGYGDYYNTRGDEHSRNMIEEAVRVASLSDVVVACVGELPGWSGEVNSRVDIGLPPSQKALLKALKDTGKPVVVVVMSGRPLVLTDENAHFPALVQAWHGGTSAADALADVLTGSVNPSGKLTMSFPRYKGQVPIHYNHLNTGRPIGQYQPPYFTSRYTDIPMEDNEPLFPFGYGLSYTTYGYAGLKANKQEAHGQNDSIVVSVKVRNTGLVAGREVVQLYITDLLASVSRPVLELKDFQSVNLAPGESRTVSFTISPEQLSFYGRDLKYIWEPGEFEISVGPNSRQLQKLRIRWER